MSPLVMLSQASEMHCDFPPDALAQPGPASWDVFFLAPGVILICILCIRYWMQPIIQNRNFQGYHHSSTRGMPQTAQIYCFNSGGQKSKFKISTASFPVKGCKGEHVLDFSACLVDGCPLPMPSHLPSIPSQVNVFFSVFPGFFQCYIP